MSAEIRAMELELSRAMRSGEDRVAFDLIERLRIARKRLLTMPVQVQA